jgi:hypothetical protein
VPNRGYGSYYWRDWSGEFERVLAAAWKVTHVMEDIHGASGIYLNGEHSNKVRNRFMVDTAAEFLAWNTGSTGTDHCVKAINRARKPCRDLSKPAALPIHIARESR